MPFSQRTTLIIASEVALRDDYGELSRRAQVVNPV
jgi:hypothetical protein